MDKIDIERLQDRFYKEYHEKNFDVAIELLKSIQQHEKKLSFWIYSRLSSCYYELRDYNQALFYIKIAYKLKPNSPLVLWDYAGVLIALKKAKKAVKLLLRIKEMNNDLILYGFVDANEKWMQSLKNDANFQIARAYYIMCEDASAKDYFQKYLLQRKRGIKTLYTKKQVSDYLKKLESN